jgi:hypothetical protein
MKHRETLVNFINFELLQKHYIKYLSYRGSQGLNFNHTELIKKRKRICPSVVGYSKNKKKERNKKRKKINITSNERNNDNRWDSQIMILLANLLFSGQSQHFMNTPNEFNMLLLKLK